MSIKHSKHERHRGSKLVFTLCVLHQSEGWLTFHSLNLPSGSFFFFYISQWQQHCSWYLWPFHFKTKKMLNICGSTFDKMPKYILIFDFLFRSMHTHTHTPSLHFSVSAASSVFSHCQKQQKRSRFGFHLASSSSRSVEARSHWSVLLFANPQSSKTLLVWFRLNCPAS